MSIVTGDNIIVSLAVCRHTFYFFYAQEEEHTHTATDTEAYI